MFPLREENWEDMMDGLIRAKEKERVVEMLGKAKDIVSWVRNEINRLKTHIEGAKIAQAAGDRGSFALWPLRKRWEDAREGRTEGVS